MKGIVDRVEAGIAIVETDDGMIDIPLENTSLDIGEGDVVILSTDKKAILCLDIEETESRHKRIQSLFDRLKK